jgi:transcriptional regulator with XRE-family HTH domain
MAPRTARAPGYVKSGRGGISQLQLAEAAWVSENTVRPWERGRRAPSHEYALQVLRALRARGVPEAELRWLLEGSSSPVGVKEPMQTQAHCRPTASQKAISSMPGKAPLR